MFWKQEYRSGDFILSLDIGEQHKQNVLKMEALEELDIILSANRPQSLIITSRKPASFCAGADINQLRELLGKPEEIKKLLAKTHQLLLKIHNAPYPTVAAISGECLGGGLELALACKARVASSDPTTRFGLPEITLGLIPGFGGTQLLPHLVGSVKALEIIVGQKKLNAQEALRIGLVDNISEDPVAEAVKLVNRLKTGEKIPRNQRRSKIELIPLIGHKLIMTLARKKTLRETKGVYPAPLLAVKAVDASNQQLEKGLEAESNLFLQAAGSSEAKNLIDIFFLRQEARSRKWIDAPPQEPPKKVGVIGAGVMGRSIAYALISRGIPVLLQDSFGEQAITAIDYIWKQLTKDAQKSKLTIGEAEKRIRLLTPSVDRMFEPVNIEDLHETDFVIEAVTENLEVKKNLLANLEKSVGPETIIASNTSSLLPSDISKALGKRDRFVAMHFFNPPHIMDLVEIAGTAETSLSTLAKTLALAKTLGKTPVVLDKECPGLIVNRVMMRYLALNFKAVIESGLDPWILDATFEKCGMAMGPCKTLDLIGLNTVAQVMEAMKTNYRDFTDFPFNEIDLLIRSHLLGQKTGRGFYIWQGAKPVRPNKNIVKNFETKMRDKPTSEFLAAFQTENVNFAMRREAEKIYTEGVCKDRNLIDLALILGGGILPNRRGLLK